MNKENCALKLVDEIILEYGKVISPTHRPPLPLGNIPGTHSCQTLSRFSASPKCNFLKGRFKVCTERLKAYWAGSSGVFDKVKGKGRLWVLQHCCLEAYCTLTRMSSFIHLQRRCTHQAA